MDQSASFAPMFECVVDAAELSAVEGALGPDGRVVIIGCTPPWPPIKPGQIPWNPWIGQPYPGGF